MLGAAGPVQHLLARLIDPDIALTQSNRAPDREQVVKEPITRQTAVLELAHRLHAAQDWAELADLYQHLSDRAWREHQPATSLRLLLAERYVAERMDNQPRAMEATTFLAQRHRLRSGFLVAEMWNRVLLSVELTKETALAHARAWRELAAIREVAAGYDEGLLFCDQAIAVCRCFADQPGVPKAHVQALLQKAVIERLRGALDNALEAVQEARLRAEGVGVDVLTAGLIALREGGIELVIGRYDVALEAYQRAEASFAGISTNNLILTQVRQVACLRALHRLDDAREITDRLLTQYRAAGDSYRLGQVLLERAEVLQDQGDGSGVAQALQEARPVYEGAQTLEALRWHRHLARNMLDTGGDTSQAAEHLRIVLDLAARPGRRDLTRTMLVLHDLLRLPETAAVTHTLWFAAGRAALLAADLQRDSLHPAEARWAVHAQREEVYSTAVLLHAEAGDANAVAQITETGRADLLNQVLSSGTGRAPGALTDLPVIQPPADPGLIEGVFDIAATASTALHTGCPPARVALPPLPGELPPAADLDGMADVIVLAHLGTGPKGWWSSTVTRTRGTSWRVDIQQATAPVEALLNRLHAGELLSPRGVTKATWAALGTFLLPNPEIWRGSPDKPRSVAICPDPRLWQLPHAALIRDSVHFADVAEVTLTPSLRTLHLLHRRARSRDNTAVLSPGSHPAISLLDPALPGYLVELATLDAWPGGHQPVDNLGSISIGSRAALFYVSGHADRPGASSALGPVSITLDHLASQVLPPLVILNGCWSGTAASHYGRDPLSLAIGGLLGGADTVISGIGRIGSIASAHVADLALRTIRQGQPARSALRDAQRRIRDEHPELGPFEWAGLCAIGIGS